MTREKAAALVKQMLGSYPTLSLHDPETFMAGMVLLLMGYPSWAGAAAVRRAIGSDECKFSPPTQGILRPLLEAEVRVHRYAAEWEQNAEKQMALPAPARPSEEERQAFIAKRRAELGPTWGIATGRKAPPTMEQARDALIAEIGQDAFDAMPDAGIRTDDWQKLRAPKIEAAE